MNTKINITREDLQIIMQYTTEAMAIFTIENIGLLPMALLIQDKWAYLSVLVGWLNDEYQAGRVGFAIKYSGDEMCGFICFTVMSEEAAFIEYIYVKEKYRHKGIAQDLLNGLKIKISTLSAATGKVELFEKCGFKRYTQTYNGLQLMATQAPLSNNFLMLTIPKEVMISAIHAGG